MRFGRILFCSTILIAGTLTALAVTPTRRGPTSAKNTKHSKPAPRHAAGQKSIDPQRATELQVALIKAGYLTGEPSGKWDEASQAAMQKLQADNGWQTKLVPDSRAIIKLGLGPAQDNVALGVTTADATNSAAN